MAKLMRRTNPFAELSERLDRMVEDLRGGETVRQRVAMDVIQEDGAAAR